VFTVHEFLLFRNLFLIVLIDFLVHSELFFKLGELRLKVGLFLYRGFLVGIDLAGSDEVIKGGAWVGFDNVFGFG
jgi:hypothetical protein